MSLIKTERKFKKQKYLGYKILDLSNLFIYHLFYDKYQLSNGQGNLQTQNWETDFFGMVVYRKLDQQFRKRKFFWNKIDQDFCKRKNYPEIFSEDNELVLGRIKTDIPENLDLDNL